MTHNTTDTAAPLAFSPIELSQREQAERIRLACGNTLYVYSFASLFAWQEDEQYEICLRDDAFLIKNGAAGAHTYLFPCGTDEAKKDLIDTLLQYEQPVFTSLTDKDKHFLEKAYPQQFSFDEIRDEFIYLYDRKEQVALEGKAFRNLRRNINAGRAKAFLEEA